MRSYLKLPSQPQAEWVFMTNNEEKILTQFGYKQELKRAFGVWQLTAFGLNYMIPIAPAMIFGLILRASGGTVALPYLLAFGGMLFTAFCYAYFIKHYPLAGSLYVYVTKAIGERIGFLAGWCLLLDYILIPNLAAMSAAYFLKNLIPNVSYELILVTFICVVGLLSLIGSKSLARLGLTLLIVGEVVIFSSFFVWSRAVVVHHIGVGHLISMEPFHFLNFSALTAASSIAILSYLGFDGISTLAEEAKFPRRDIPRAIYLSVTIGLITMLLTGYIGMLVIPNWHAYINNPDWMNTTLFFVSEATGGKTFVLFYTVGFVIAMVIFNITATVGASRLLFGISRDGKIPLSFLSLVSKKNHVPINCMLASIFLQLIISSLFDVDKVTLVVNFGALTGFLLMNIATFLHIAKHKPYHKWQAVMLAVPVIGALLNFWILIHLGVGALVLGVIWSCLGLIVYLAYKKSREDAVIKTLQTL